MRFDLVRSMAFQVLAGMIGVSLAAPTAAAQGENGAPQAGGLVPLVAVRGEETCKLVEVRDGESAELIEERTRERGEQFPFLDPERQGQLLEEFQVDVQSCAVIFGITPAPGAQAAAAGAAAAGGLGATLAGAGVVTAVSITVPTIVLGTIIATGAAGGGGGGPNNTLPPTSTTD